MRSIEFYAEIPLGTTADGLAAIFIPDIEISATIDQDGDVVAMEVLSVCETGQDINPTFDAPIAKHLNEFIERNWALFASMARERLDEIDADDEAPEYYRDAWMDKTLEAV